MATQTVRPVPVPRRQTGRVLNEEVLEHYRTLVCQALGYGTNGSTLVRTLGVTGCRRGDGASTVAAHLAITAAATSHRRVLLVDCDMTAPSLHLLLHAERSPGVREAVSQPDKVSGWVQESGISNLAFLPAGAASSAGGPVWDDHWISVFLETLRCEFDLIVFDLPAGLIDFSALRLASLLDGVLLVVEAESTRMDTARRLKDLAARAHVNVLGAVLNERHH